MEDNKSPWRSFQRLGRRERQWMLLREVTIQEVKNGRTTERMRFEYEVLTDEQARGINNRATRANLVQLTEREAFWRLFRERVEAIRDEHTTVGGSQLSMAACFKTMLRRLKTADTPPYPISSANDWADVLASILRKIVRDEAREASGHTRSRLKRSGTDAVAVKKTSVSDHRAATSRKASKEFREKSLPIVTRRVFRADGTHQYVPVTLVPSYKPVVSIPLVKHHALAYRARREEAGSNVGAFVDAEPTAGVDVEDNILESILERATLALCQQVRKALAASNNANDQRALKIVDAFLREEHPDDLAQKKKKWKWAVSEIAGRHGWTINQTQNALRALASHFSADGEASAAKIASRMGMSDRELELQKLALPKIRVSDHK